MANRIYKGRSWNAHQDLVELKARIYCKATGGGVDATKSDIPASYMTVEYVSAGLYNVTFTDGFVDLLDFQGSLANNGTATTLDETWAVRVKGLPTVAATAAVPCTQYSVQSPSSTIPLNVVHSGNVADLGFDFVIFTRWTFRQSGVYAP